MKKNLIQISDFEFRGYRRGLQRLFADLRIANVELEERTLFARRMTGRFLRIARLRNHKDPAIVLRRFNITREFLEAVEAGEELIEASLWVDLLDFFGVGSERHEFDLLLRGACEGRDKQELLLSISVLKQNGFITSDFDK